jgi:hypothetical protein
MKTSQLSATLLSIVVFGAAAFGQANVSIKIVNQSASQVLELYRSLAGADLVMDTNVQQAQGRITIEPKGQISVGDATRMIEIALREQASVVLNRQDDGRVSVAYTGVSNQGGPALPPGMPSGTFGLKQDMIRKGSVRVFGPDKGANLSFVFAGKTQPEIQKLMTENLGKKIRILEGDTERALSGVGGGFQEGANTVGLVLIFETKAEANVAARVLRGETDK